MSAENNPRSERRARRSTRIGIAVIIALAVIVIALVWAFTRDDDDEPDAPSVNAPVLIASYASGDHFAGLAA